jgi:hypothetical protein
MPVTLLLLLGLVLTINGQHPMTHPWVQQVCGNNTCIDTDAGEVNDCPVPLDDCAMDACRTDCGFSLADMDHCWEVRSDRKR